MAGHNGVFVAVGAWIRERRKVLGLSQTALGERTGAAQNQVSQWETNKHSPSPSQLTRLIEVLGPVTTISNVAARVVQARNEETRFSELKVGAADAYHFRFDKVLDAGTGLLDALGFLL